jgi:hypothetical protein
MEGRLMLSASTAADYFMQMHLTAADFGLDSVPSSIASDLASPRAAVPTEGGYISTPVSPPGGALVGDVDQTPEPGEVLVDQVTSGPLTDTTTSNSNNSTYSAGPESNYSGIRPIVFPNWEPLEFKTASAGPTLSTFDREQPIRDDGGAISIESVLESVNSLEDPASDASVESMLASTTPDESPAPHRLAAVAAPSSSEISGEWARAMAFEIVGGEPTETEPNTRHDRAEGKVDDNGELSPNYRQPTTTNSARSSTRDFVPERAAVESSRHEAGTSDTAAIGPLRTFAFERNSSEHRLGGNSDSTLHSTLRAGRHLIVQDPNPVGSAHADVFEQLGVDKNPASLSLALDLSWRGALNATPFLMMLALERIAASNSRRINHHDAAVSAFRVRRGASLPGLERLA